MASTFIPISEPPSTAQVEALIDIGVAEAEAYTDTKIALLANSKITDITFTLYDEGAPLTTGSKLRFSIPYACTINSSTLLADASGDLILDVKKSTYAAFPTTASICAAAKPTLSAVQKATDATLTGWTTAIAAGDVLELIVEGTPTVNAASLTLKVTKT